MPVRPVVALRDPMVNSIFDRAAVSSGGVPSGSNTHSRCRASFLSCSGSWISALSTNTRSAFDTTSAGSASGNRRRVHTIVRT